MEYSLPDLPVRVEGVEVQDPIIVVFGQKWSLMIACPWAGNVGDSSLSWEDRNLERGLQMFVAQELTRVEREDGGTRFEFTLGSLTAYPDTDLDPWVLSIPSGLVVGQRI